MTTTKKTNAYDQVLQYTGSIFAGELHQKRLLSITTAVFGLARAGSVAISAIAAALGLYCGLNPKHAAKQVDRMFSNKGIKLSAIFPSLIRFLIGERTKIVVALDWTEFDKDGQSNLALHFVNRNGRTCPLMWKTVYQDELKDNRNNVEDELLSDFKAALPQNIHVTLLADRGFVDVKFFAFLRELGFDFIIRAKKNITVSFDGYEPKSIILAFFNRQSPPSKRCAYYQRGILSP